VKWLPSAVLVLLPLFSVATNAGFGLAPRCRSQDPHPDEWAVRELQGWGHAVKRECRDSEGRNPRYDLLVLRRWFSESASGGDCYGWGLLTRVVPRRQRWFVEGLDSVQRCVYPIALGLRCQLGLRKTGVGGIRIVRIEGKADTDNRV